MVEEMDLRTVLKELTEALGSAGISYSLIGGLALAPHGAGRATTDVDLLVDDERADDVDRIITEMGYERRHRSADVGNYLSDDPARGRIDVLFAHREHTRRMLAESERYTVLGRSDVRVVDAEDLIGLKVQGMSNDTRRYRMDIADIQRLIEASAELDMNRVRFFFRLFECEHELDSLLADLEDA